jgi:hypothetical protein
MAGWIGNTPYRRQEVKASMLGARFNSVLEMKSCPVFHLVLFLVAHRHFLVKKGNMSSMTMY